MDVQVVAAQAAAPQPLPAQAAPAPVAPVMGGSVGNPPADPPSAAQGALSPVIAKLFGQADEQHSIAVNVSYRVVHDPNEIVTVFSDPSTGQEIAQFPSELLVQIAQFFDKHNGVTLDQNA